MSRVLIVEDEQHIGDGLRFNLEAEGFDVELVETGEAALDLLKNDGDTYQLLVLDVMLPGISGFEVMTRLRELQHFIPTLMLTARGRPDDILQGFEAGADDYLPKPFELSILLARINGLLRRQQWNKTRKDVYDFNGRVIDFGKLELQVGQETLALTLMEANLLRYLIQHEGEAVSRKTMLEEVWGVHEDTDTRAIDNFVVRLRKYIEEEPARPRHLLTVRGVGYRFVAQPED
jgi:two-component system alkaline phosphatase synthesis response regulator PhoP